MEVGFSSRSSLSLGVGRRCCLVWQEMNDRLSFGWFIALPYIDLNLLVKIQDVPTSKSLEVRGENYLDSYRARKWLISLINVLAFGFIWKLWICSFKWGIAACSPPRNDWVPSQNVEGCWLRLEQLRKPKNNTKFDEVWNVLNQLCF